MVSLWRRRPSPHPDVHPDVPTGCVVVLHALTGETRRIDGVPIGHYGGQRLVWFPEASHAVSERAADGTRLRRVMSAEGLTLALYEEGTFETIVSATPALVAEIGRVRAAWRRNPPPLPMKAKEPAQWH